MCSQNHKSALHSVQQTIFSPSIRRKKKERSKLKSNLKDPWGLSCFKDQGQVTSVHCFIKYQKFCSGHCKMMIIILTGIKTLQRNPSNRDAYRPSDSLGKMIFFIQRSPTNPPMTLFDFFYLIIETGAYRNAFISFSQHLHLWKGRLQPERWYCRILQKIRLRCVVMLTAEHGCLHLGAEQTWDGLS